MDRTIAITRFNTEEIAMEVDKVIKKGLDKLLGDHLYRYELLEKTHEAIMNLPSIRNHLNQSPYEYTPYDFVKEYNSSNKLKVDTNELDIKYGALLEKLITRIDNLTDEINKLKSKSVKDVVDLTTDEIQIKLEYPIKIEQQVHKVIHIEKENIRLEFEETVDDDLEKANDFKEEDTSAGEDEEEDEEEDEDEEDEVSVAADDTSVAEDASVAEDTSVAEDASVAAEDEDDVSAAEVVEDDKNVCSDCECKVILDEDITIVDGKKHCGACNPNPIKEDDQSEVEDDVETEKSDSEEEDTSVAEEEEEVTSVESVAEAEDEEYIEIDIDDVTYCTNNEENGFIYQLTEDGDVGDKVGYLKDGEPFFYADEK